MQLSLCVGLCNVQVSRSTIATTDHDLEVDAQRDNSATLEGVPVHIFAAQLGDSFNILVHLPVG